MNNNEKCPESHRRLLGLFLLYRKFPKSSKIVYNELEIKDYMTKERRCYFAMTLFMKFFVSVQYQQIVDLIDRFQKIDAAIVASNANAEITTSYGTFTVAGAIALRSRLCGIGAYGGSA